MRASQVVSGVPAAGGQRDRHRVAGGPLDQGRHRRPTGLADHQVALPGAGHGPVAGLGGAGVDAGHTHDPGPRAGAASAGTTPGPPGTQQDPLARELPLGQRVDPGVDRLVRHRVGHPLSVLTAVFVAQPARDLIRGVPRP